MKKYSSVFLFLENVVYNKISFISFHQTMKKILLLLLSLWLIGSSNPGYTISESTSSDTAYYEQKKLAEQDASTKMRWEYYQKYKAKWGYDLSILTPEILDGRVTNESQFWEALKNMQNLKEIPERKMYAEKLIKYGADASDFTENIIADSWKFWEMYKKWEWVLKSSNPVPEKKEVNDTPVKKEVETPKYVQQEQKYPQQVQKPQTQDRAIKLFVTRLDKVPSDKLPNTLIVLQKNIKKQLEIASKRGSKFTVSRLEQMLKIVEERMESDSDEALIEGLFAN